MNSEIGYGIFVIKPDGYRKKVYEKFEKYINSRGFQIIKKRQKKLTINDVKNNFSLSFDSYISYMTSDPVIALFVTAKAKDFSELMYNTKMKFRTRFGINKNEIENLVHSSDDGMEFYLQRNLFFPEFCIQSLSLSSDMLVNIPKGLEDKYMNFIIHDTNLKYISVFIENYQRVHLFEKYKNLINISYISESCKKVDEYVVHIYRYFKDEKSCYNFYNCNNYNDDSIKNVIGKIDGLHFNFNYSIKTDSPVYSFQNNMSIFENSFLMLYNKIKNTLNIDGLLVESPDINLVESACRYFFSEEHSLCKCAGSLYSNMIGIFSVPNCYVKDFWGFK